MFNHAEPYYHPGSPLDNSAAQPAHSRRPAAANVFAAAAVAGQIHFPKSRIPSALFPHILPRLLRGAAAAAAPVTAERSSR